MCLKLPNVGYLRHILTSFSNSVNTFIAETTNHNYSTLITTPI